MEQKKKIGLLEDLHSEYYTDQVAEALELVEPGWYSLKELSLIHI